MRRNLARLIFVSFLALVFAAGCRDKSPVARVTPLPPVIKLTQGQCTSATLRWNMLRALDRQRGNAVVFVHLLEPPRHVLRTYDHPFPGTWKAGAMLDDPLELCQSIDAPAVKPGRYRLSVGLYDSEAGHRWSLITTGVDLKPREYDIASVEVVAAPGGASELRYEGAWGPLTLTTDQQVLMRRKVMGPASIVTLHPQTNTLRLTIGVNDKNARAIVSSSCSPSARQELPPGYHHISMPACEQGQIRIEPSGGTVLLDSVAWMQ